MRSGIFLIGIGVGSLFSGPFSETFGRNAVYFVTLVLVIVFTLGKALAPNYGAALAFRFICALFAAAPMTVAGGTVGDIWQPLQIPFGLPMLTMAAYMGPILGPVIGAYTPKIGFVWADWISIIIAGVVLIVVILGQPETYSPILLEWRAKHLRDLTGDGRYRAEHSAVSSSFSNRLLTNVYRPFVMIWTEPLILIFSFYLVLLYFVLFTFLNGYPFIFANVYGISTSLTFIIFVAMVPGVLVALLLVPLLYSLTKKAAKKADGNGKVLQPEVSLWWAMAGASVLMPISLFWMAWTCYVSVRSILLSLHLLIPFYLLVLYQYLVADRGLWYLRLFSCLHLHYNLYVYHLCVLEVCSLGSGIYDIFTVRRLRHSEPGLGQDV
jgi:MFS family permease